MINTKEDIILTEGDTYSQSYTLSNLPGGASYSDYYVVFCIKEKFDDTDGEAIIKKSTQFSTDTALIELTHAETLALDAKREYVYDAKIYMALNAYVGTCQSGDFIPGSTVTQAPV